MRFSYQGATCTATYDFSTTCARDTLLGVLHDYRHIVKYLSELALTIDSVDHGPGWNRLRYTYFYVVYTLTVTFMRVRNDSAGTVSFDLEQAHASSGLIPSAAAIHGWYHVVPEGDHNRVYYSQTTTMSRDLNRLYAYLIHRELRRFLRRMERYINERQY